MGLIKIFSGEEILAKSLKQNLEDADINVCLGDWFDSFNYDENSDRQKKHAKFIKNKNTTF